MGLAHNEVGCIDRAIDSGPDQRTLARVRSAGPRDAAISGRETSVIRIDPCRELAASFIQTVRRSRMPVLPGRFPDRTNERQSGLLQPSEDATLGACGLASESSDWRAVRAACESRGPGSRGRLGPDE
jgi:hypothetical protein